MNNVLLEQYRFDQRDLEYFKSKNKIKKKVKGIA